jgi:hypothetical protein
MNKNLIDLKNLNIVKQIKAIRLIEDIDIDIKEFLIDQSNINIMIDICLSKDFTEIIKELAKTFPDLVANCNLSQDYFDEKIEQYFTSYKSIHHLEIICKAFLHLTPKITQIDYDKKMDRGLSNYFRIKNEVKYKKGLMKRAHFHRYDMEYFYELRSLEKEELKNNQCFALATSLPHLAINFTIEQEIFNDLIMDFFDKTDTYSYSDRFYYSEKLAQMLPANALKFPQRYFDILLTKCCNADSCSHITTFHNMFPNCQVDKACIDSIMKKLVDKNFNNFNGCYIETYQEFLKALPYLAEKYKFSQEDFNKLMEECPKDKVGRLNEAFPIMAINYIKKDKFAELK